MKKNNLMTRDGYLLPYDGAKAMAALDRLAPFLYRKRREYEVARELWVKGRLSERSGPKGFPAEIWRLRDKLAGKLRRMK